jgi:hypothetical protein
MSVIRRIINKLFRRRKRPKGKNDASIYPMF